MTERFWIPLTVVVLLAASVCAAAASGVAPSLRLAQRFSDATVVVEGRVSRAQPFDHDRVRVLQFSVRRVLKGESRLSAPTSTLEIVEMRDRPAAPALLETGDNAVLFLGRMERGSYLDETIGVGRRWKVAHGPAGAFRARDEVVVTRAGDLVERLANRSRAPGKTVAERAAERRAWTFAALAARHEALVEEGAHGLVDIPKLRGSVTPEERQVIETALRREDLSPRVRAVLLTALAEADLRSLAPVLASLQVDDAAEVDALWKTRVAFGDAPRSATVAGRLRDASPKVRAVAARAYVSIHEAEAIAALPRFLADEPEPDVRIAALEALGPCPREEATEIIETSFVEDGALVVRQAAGRVLFERGGDAAAESFGRLAFEAAPEGQRHAVALLMALQRPADDPILKKIRETHPDEKTREIATHGFGDSHH